MNVNWFICWRLYKAHKDHSVVKHTLQINLDAVNNWYAVNNMSLNSAKTKYMILTTPYKHRVLENENDKSCFKH